MMTIEEINEAYKNVPDTIEGQFDQILANVTHWVDRVSCGYKDIIIQSSHYPFGIDCPVTIWIRKCNPKNPLLIYSMDWDLFNISNYPKIYYKGKSDGIDPFEYLEKYWDKKNFQGASTLRGLLDIEWDKSQYIIEDPGLLDIGLAGSECGTKKPLHQVTDTTHLCVSKDYDGDVYLELYVVARR